MNTPGTPSQHLLQCRREMSVVEFFSRHCDIDNQDNTGLYPAHCVINNNIFHEVSDHPIFLRLLKCLLNVKLINDFSSSFLGQLIMNKWWDALRMVLREIGVAPDVIAISLNIYFPLWILPEDIAVYMNVPNESSELLSTCSQYYSLKRNPSQYRNLCNGMTSPKDGFVVVNINPHLKPNIEYSKPILSHPNWYLHILLTMISRAAFGASEGVYTGPFAEVIQDQMFKSLSAILMGIELNLGFDCFDFVTNHGERCYFHMEFNNFNVVIPVEKKLKLIKIYFEIFLGIGVYEKIKPDNCPNLQPQEFANDPDFHLIQDINEMWRKFLIRKHQVKDLKTLCVERIRGLMSPVTAEKIEKAELHGVYFNMMERKPLAEWVMRKIKNFR